MPADPLHISLYLVKKINASRSPAPVSDALHSIAWMHQISQHVHTCKTDIVKRVHQAPLPHLACPRQRKTPLSKKLLKKLGKLLTTGKLADLQTLTLITLGFAGCLRCDDLSHICVDGLSLHRDYMAVFLQSRKNDQLREGSWVLVSHCKGTLYPVALTEQLLDQGLQTQLAPLFGRLRSLGGKQVIQDTMSYSRASVRTALALVGEDLDKYGQHSLRSAGISAAAGAGVPDRLIQHRADWKSESLTLVLHFYALVACYYVVQWM